MHLLIDLVSYFPMYLTSFSDFIYKISIYQIPICTSLEHNIKYWYYWLRYSLRPLLTIISKYDLPWLVMDVVQVSGYNTSSLSVYWSDPDLKYKNKIYPL